MPRSLHIAALLLACLSIPACAQQSQDQQQKQEWRDFMSSFTAPPTYDPPHANVNIDVVVTDEAGKPVAGLGPTNFKLFDNNRPEKILYFQAFDETSQTLHPPVEVILLVDAVDLDSKQVPLVENEIQKFLRENNGRLTQPVSIYRLTNAGLSASMRQSIDGNTLADEVARGKEPRVIPVHDIQFRPTLEGAERHSDSGLRALGSIAIELRRKPGRKLLIWFGPGWPVGETAWEPEIGTRLREARIALDCVTAWPPPEVGIDPSGKRTSDLALAALATQSGGRVLESLDDLAGLIRESIAQAGVYYTLWFDPPRTDSVDDLHSLNVFMDNPRLRARTQTLYYDEPVFYDQPNPPLEKLTPNQLEQRLARAQGSRDGELAQRLGAVVLTERMSSSRLAYWKAQMPGEKSRAGLVALADASTFLDPPADRTPADPPPDIAAQRAMLSETITYLHNAIPRLPDFYAQRTTHLYGELPQKGDQTWKTATGNGALRLANTSVATLLYRNGKEEVDAEKVKVKLTKEEESMNTKGTFGPILSTVLVDAARSSLTWSRWVQGSEGKRAVFRFVVPKEKSHYSVSFCCLTDMSQNDRFEQITGYHGEVTIDPVTGTILRLTVQADLDPRMPLERADIMVSYGPVSIGGKTFICPTRSITIGRKRTIRTLHEWGQSLRVFGPFVTMLSDSSFDSYHKFGSESRMLPGFTPASTQQ